MTAAPKCTPIPMTAALLAGLAAAPGGAADAERRGPDPNDVRVAVDKALAFLKTTQTADGGFAPRLGGPGVSALVAAGLIRHGRGDDPTVQKTLKYLERSVKPDGGIYDRRLANYTTCVALIAFKEANTQGQYDAVIAGAARFLKSLQFADGATDPKDVRYGGVGYDGRSRPDLSNTQYFVDALLAAGLSKTDQSVQQALAFVSRCQNLPGENNDRLFALKATPEDKGGFVYTPFEPDEKDPRRTPAGGLRSEGVMTYSGLKSFLYAGVSPDDPRVKAAIAWIRKHYTLDENPGQGTAGLYYYYHVFGKSMEALGEDPFLDAQGRPHDWRADLFAALKKRQRPDGSWANDNSAFMETSPELATAYAILALSYCTPPRK
jgi:squalene-hopene/tetraprenyl-beta-curcumene cyclase